MATAPPPDKPPDTSPRHVYGPRPVGAVLPAIVRPAFRSQGAATAQLMADWPAIVGPALAAATRPNRLAAGTLTLGCAGPVALELQHLASQLIERINAHAGRPLVQRLRFTQAMPDRPDPAPPPRVPRRLDPVPVAGLPDGPLRDALAALGAAVRADRA